MDEPWMRPAVADHSTALLHRGSPLAAIPLSKRVFRLQCLSVTSVTAKQFTFQTCPEHVSYTPLWPVRLMRSPGNKKNGIQNINFPTEMNISSWQLLSQISPDVHAKADMVPSVRMKVVLSVVLSVVPGQNLCQILFHVHVEIPICEISAASEQVVDIPHGDFWTLKHQRLGLGLNHWIPLVGIVLYWGLLHDHLASLPT